MIIDHAPGDRVYAVIPHPNGALVVVGRLAEIHIKAGGNTAVIVTPDRDQDTVPLGAVKTLRVRDGEPAMYEVEAEVIRIVGALLATKADPTPAPPVGTPVPVEF